MKTFRKTLLGKRTSGYLAIASYIFFGLFVPLVHADRFFADLQSKKMKSPIIVLALASLMLLGALVFAPSHAHAEGEQFLFAYPKKAVNDIKKDIEDNKKANNVMSATTVSVKGGVFGNTEFTLPFVANGQNDNKNEYVYSQVYDCTDSGLVRGSLIPRPGLKFYKVAIAARVKLDSGFNDKNPTGFAAVPRLVIKEGDNEETYGSNGKIVDLNDLPRACRPSIGSITLKNYQKLSDSEKRKWNSAKTKVDNEESSYQAINADDKETDSVTDCDTKLTNPLSWVMCPLIDLGANTTDFIFNKVAKPLLSEIPISTSKDDPIYKAWNGFRFIANIILIGSMLAIVYAQAKGPK